MKAYALLRRRERKKREKLMEGWRRAKWLRFMLRRARVRYVHVHARHVVRARREVHEEGALTCADIFGTDSEDEVYGGVLGPEGRGDLPFMLRHLLLSREAVRACPIVPNTLQFAVPTPTGPSSAR